MPILDRFSVPSPAKTLRVGRSLSDLQTRCILKFDGQIDAERMGRAVQLTIDAEPLLGCRFVEHPIRPYWQRLDRTEAISLFTFLTAQSTESGIIKTFLARPMEACIGPQMQAGLFHAREDTLCVKISHMVVDGGGLKNCVELLAAIYRKLKNDPGYVPRPNLHTNHIFGQVCRQVGPLRLIKASAHHSIPRSGWGTPTTCQDFSDPVFEVRHIDVLRVTEIKTYCKRQQVTMTDVLLTAFYRALFELVNPAFGKELPLMVTVDLRRHLPPIYAGTICDLASAFFVTIRRLPEQSFEDTLSKISKITKSARARQEWLMALCMELLFLPGFYFGKRVLERERERQNIDCQMFPIFSNIGVLEPNQFDFGDVAIADVTLFGPTPFRPSFDVSLSTFNNRMSLTASSRNETYAQVTGRLLEGIKAELP